MLVAVLVLGLFRIFQPAVTTPVGPVVDVQPGRIAVVRGLGADHLIEAVVRPSAVHVKLQHNRAAFGGPDQRGIHVAANNVFGHLL